MLPSEKPKFVAVLNGLAAIKPGAKLTPEAYDVWWSAMKDWPLSEFSSAAAHLTKSMEFMPSPFHFDQLRKAGRPTAGEAWAAVLGYVRTGFTRWTDGGITKNKLAPPDDPLTLKAVRAIGGFDVIAKSETDKTHFLEKRFKENYESIQDADEVREYLPAIANNTFGLAALTKMHEERKLGRE